MSYKLFDVWLAELGEVDAVDIRPVQSSMGAPSLRGPGVDFLPSDGPAWPDFFWNGSGDTDADAGGVGVEDDLGVTYWVTTTVYRTTVLLDVNRVSVSCFFFLFF